MASDAEAFVEFVNRSPSPFHAVDTCIEQLRAAGFSRLSEREEWSIQPGGKYFLTRNESAIVSLEEILLLLLLFNKGEVKKKDQK